MSFPPRAATGPELALFRTPGNGSKLRAAIFHPDTIYTARINQTFSSLDGVLEIIYDTGSGTLANVLPDMTLFVGSSAGDWDLGICRVRDIDMTKVYISQTSDIKFANNQYLTIVNDFGLWAKHVSIVGGVPFMDGDIEYDDQHTNMDPVPIMGGHRVLKLIDATVETTFDFSLSYMPDGSAIDTFATTSPTASGGSGLSTDTPTLAFDAVGWHLVYLTLTGENGKSFFGVRYVYVWDDDNAPARAVIGDNGQDIDSGGWHFSLTLFDNCDLTDLHDHALVLLFADDYYGDTKQEIGPLTGCENVVLTGWISREKIDINPDYGLVEFTAYTAQHFFEQIPSYPDGVEFTAATPTAWTEIQNLTVDLGVWHFLHWRSTATRVMDVFLSGDEKYSPEVSSLAGNLWEQLKEMTYMQIFARPGVNRYNQLYTQVHPQLIPEADRSSIPVVMDITKQDRVAGISFDRVTMPEVSIVDGSGIFLDGSGNGTPFFGIAPGRTLPHYGSRDGFDHLLVESQAHVNLLCGLYRSWRNNPLPDIPIEFLANNRLIECFPNQYCETTIDAADNPRGYGYSGKLIPTSVSFVYDATTGYLHTEANFEAETLESAALDGDYPGSDDVTSPPVPRLPSLPLPPVFFPGLPGDPPAESTTVVVRSHNHPTSHNVAYTEDFDSTSPTWFLMNSGLTFNQINMADFLRITPSGAVYLGKHGTWVRGASDGEQPFLAYAPAVGSPWTIIEDPTTIEAAFVTGTTLQLGGFGARTDQPDTFLYVAGQTLAGSAHEIQVYLGSGGGGFAPTLHSTTSAMKIAGSSSFGLDTWGLTVSGLADEIDFIRLSADTTTDLFEVYVGGYGRLHTRAGLLGILFKRDQNIAGSKFARTTDNGDTWAAIPVSDDMTFAQPVIPNDTGQFLMGNWSVGARGRSSDFGSTWYGIPNLPVGGNYAFAYAGGTTWIAAAGIVRESPDFGETWLNREGNLASILPSAISIDLVAVLREEP